MCLAIPGRVESVVPGPSGDLFAVVEYPGERRTVNLLYLPETRIGEYVVVQAGFAIRRLTPDQARETLDAMAEAEERASPAPGGVA